MTEKKLVHFVTSDRLCIVDESIVAKLREVSVIFQALIRPYKKNEDYITVDIQFCSSREFYKFINFVADLLNGTLELRLFHEDITRYHELLDYAVKFDSPSLKQLCSDEIRWIIQRGNLSLGEVSDLFLMVRQFRLPKVFTKLVKFLCNKYYNVTDNEETKTADDEIKKFLKPKLPLTSVYVVLKLLADYRRSQNDRFHHEYEFENVCKNPDCISLSLYCIKCKFTICRSCGTHCKRSYDNQLNLSDKEIVCFNCKKSFRDCVCPNDKCSMCSNCEKSEEQCQKGGECEEMKLFPRNWEDFLGS